MKKLQSNRRGIHQAQRALQKVNKLREQVVRSTQAFLARREQRLAWWQRAFRAPAVSQRWLFSQASSLWTAFMSLFGLTSEGRKSKFSHARTSNPSRGHRYVRAGAARLLYESLES